MTITQLGRKVEQPNSPEDAVLETIDLNPEDLVQLATIRLSVPEFTSLCPITGQPDYARIYIDYRPMAKLVESKSLKLFMASFRNHGAFHEVATAYIGRRLQEALNPSWLRVSTFWYPRGGIPIDVVWETSEKPSGVFVLPLDIKAFDGR
jgi:7-cyano-7-deazaguanine reductase